MTDVSLAHTLDRAILICAERELVFSFFTDTARWAAWWGAGSSIDARRGGRVLIRYPGGVEVSGEVVDIAAPDRIVFTYGYVSGTPFASGGSLVTISLESKAAGTLVRLSHAFAEASVRDHHVQGWRYQLSLFANAVANDAFAHVDTVIDQWFAAWSEPDATVRNDAVHRMAAPGISMRDQFSAIEGLSDLVEHLAAVHHFMPGMRITRDGAVRQCQGMALADWIARSVEGQERGRGTNVFTLTPDGRIDGVTGFWNTR
jgi:uncharacterized protein YndB with AHSA1/START domain